MKKFKIIVDSSCDLTKSYISHENIELDVAPLSILINGETFVDEQGLDINVMLDAMSNYSGKSTTSCPSPGEYMERMNGAEHYFIVTISSKLSGSFNAAYTAIQSEEGKKVHLIDSKLVSGAMVLIVDEIVRLIELGLSYEEICTRIDQFNSERQLLFVLNKFDNLVKNGRMSKLMGIIASTLRIVPLCEGHEGEIRIAEKTITQKSAYRKLTDALKSRGEGKTKECVITHCNNEKGAQTIKEMLIEKCAFLKNIRILPMKGLCSFYALRGGVIVSF